MIFKLSARWRGVFKLEANRIEFARTQISLYKCDRRHLMRREGISKFGLSKPAAANFSNNQDWFSSHEIGSVNRGRLPDVFLDARRIAYFVVNVRIPSGRAGFDGARLPPLAP